MLQKGTSFTSDVLPARGDADAPLTDAELIAKFHALADGPLDDREVVRIKPCC